MDNDFDHGREFVEERVAYLFRNGVSLQNGLLTIHSDVHLAPQPMPHPADRGAVYVLHAIDMRCDVIEGLGFRA